MPEDRDLTALPVEDTERMAAERKLIVGLAERVFYNVDEPQLQIENALLLGFGVDMDDGEPYMVWLTSGVTISQLRATAGWFLTQADLLEEEL